MNTTETTKTAIQKSKTTAIILALTQIQCHKDEPNIKITKND